MVMAIKLLGGFAVFGLQVLHTLECGFAAVGCPVGGLAPMRWFVNFALYCSGVGPKASMIVSG